MKKWNKYCLSLFLCLCLLAVSILLPSTQAEAKSYKLNYTETVKGRKYQLDLTFTGNSKLKKVEYKTGKITSTKNSKWKNSKNYTNRFSTYWDSYNKEWFSYTTKALPFTKKTTVSFRFTTAANQKLVKVFSVNPKPKYLKGSCTLTGTLKKVKWTHPGNGSTISTYVLNLSTPKNLQIPNDYFYGGKVIYLQQRSVMLAPISNERLLKKYVGKKVSITGKLWPGGGTIYYIRPVSFDVKSIRKK